MRPTRLDFIDWLKCVGILLIVFGHVAARWLVPLTPPINGKQLGVALFLFAFAFSLARETRPTRQVLFNRLFEVFLFGVPFAVLMSGVGYFRSSGLALSNYLPFVLGANVAFDHFPANPTTWFIGTYIHILLLWALLLRGRRVAGWWLAVSVVAEVVLRAAVAETGGLYRAYMLVPNWATVFLLGLYQGQREGTPDGGRRWALLLGALVVGWPLLGGLVPSESEFPFIVFDLGGRSIDLLATSAAVTFVYAAYTYLIFRAACGLPAAAPARFFARNTLFVFIAHMPLYYALIPPVQGWSDQFWVRAVVWFLTCSLVLALISEGLRRLVRPERLRERLWGWLNGPVVTASPTPVTGGVS